MIDQAAVNPRPLDAAYDFVTTMVPRADDAFAIMWHGWALREAFIAGVEWQKKQATIAEDRPDERCHPNEALRHKLIADLFELPVWERGKDRVVTPPWQTLTVEERDLIADALKQRRAP